MPFPGISMHVVNSQRVREYDFQQQEGIFLHWSRVDAISQNSVLFLTDLRVQNKTDSELLACLSYSRAPF